MRKLTLLPLVWLTACGESSFSGQGDAKSKPAAHHVDVDTAAAIAEEPPVDAKVAVARTKTFLVQEQKTPLDLVWVIDNSLSMVEENPIVQKNFDAFAAKIEQTADLHMALISFTDSALGVKMSDKLLAKKDVQIPIRIGSTNPLTILAAAICPKDSTSDYSENSDGLNGQMRICNQTVKTLNDDDFLETPHLVTDASGTLHNFFREDADKIFVFVTDDDATFVTDSNFLPLIQPFVKGKAPVVHAFDANESSTCDVSAHGASYNNLAKHTGGASYDICATDWTEHFSRLTQAIAKTPSTFTLADHVQKVLNVKVDGKLLAPNEFHASGQTVTLTDTVFAKHPKKVDVTYLPN